jgi:AcrR family transcriptional regulator
MGRWLPDAQGRLTAAALELYAENGFEQTTVAEIAERAGVTERTFFRYFTDKREVLFAGSEHLSAVALAAVEAAPDDASAIEVVAAAITAIAHEHAPNREYSRRRAAVVSATTSLQERELLKMWSLSAALSAAVQRRGVAKVEADLAAGAGTSIYGLAFAQWVAEGETRELVEIVNEHFAHLKGIRSGA